MPADNPPRRITLINVPYNYEFTRTSVAVWRKPGEYLVKAEVADHAVANGYAIDGWAARGRVAGKEAAKPRATSRRKSATPKADAGTDIRSHQGVGGTDLAADDSASAGGAVAPAAD